MSGEMPEEGHTYMVPEHTQKALDAYIKTGRPIGHFLTAVLTNNLFEAFARADEKNTVAMKHIIMFVYNEMPSRAHGSKEKINAWIAQGGMEGMKPLKSAEEK